jgi:formate dehydrogenase subunit gamma
MTFGAFFHCKKIDLPKSRPSLASLTARAFPAQTGIDAMASRSPIAWNPERALFLINEQVDLPGALLPILHALHDEFGYIDTAAIPLVAKALNITKAEVCGVISFYHDFRTSPPGRHILRICRAEACQAMGCDSLVGHVESRLGAKLGETTRDGGFTLEPVYCLGNCALSPSVMLDGKLYGRVSIKRADALIDAGDAA